MCLMYGDENIKCWNYFKEISSNEEKSKYFNWNSLYEIGTTALKNSEVLYCYMRRLVHHCDNYGATRESSKSKDLVKQVSEAIKRKDLILKYMTAYQCANDYSIVLNNLIENMLYEGRFFPFEDVTNEDFGVPYVKKECDNIFSH